MFGERKITIRRNDRKICIIPAQIYFMEVKLPVVEFDKGVKTDDWIANEACQELFNQQGKIQL